MPLEQSASLLSGRILRIPMDTVNRAAAAGELATVFATSEISDEDRNRSEEEIMEDVIAEIKAARRQRRALGK